MEGNPLSKYESEISRRRTFAIISHPDAGKTTLTEKFLLYGGAIAQAGVVKGKKNARAATSDWMEIEKQRGISVTSSVMQFQYEGYCINILDTPGHQDFSEDTYRTLMAADSAVMVIDAAKGVEAQTRKLFKVCVMRDIPIFTFINKMDREARDPFELCEEIEKELGIDTYAVNWPIGCGKEFQGVYDRNKREIIEEAYAGDIIGVFDPGIFSIGDTLCAPGRKFRFDPIPTFAPEHFRRVRPLDTMKRKQFLKGMEQIAQEGAIQIFKTPYTGMEEVIVGVVGTLQFDVLEYRLKNEYGVDLYMEGLPYEYLRWIDHDGDEPLKEEDLILGTDVKLVEDYKGRQLLLFASQWSINWVADKNKALTLTEFGGTRE